MKKRTPNYLAMEIALAQKKQKLIDHQAWALV
jgi:hypothetical protein